MTDLSRIGVLRRAKNWRVFLNRIKYLSFFKTVSISMATPELPLSIKGCVRSADEMSAGRLERFGEKIIIVCAFREAAVSSEI